jgi:hypothetical protein
MPIRSNKTALALCLGLTVLMVLPTWAHQQAQEAIADQAGFKLGGSGVLRYLSASKPLASQGLPGYLLQGDPGVDLRGGQLEHAVLQLGYRSNHWLGAQLAVGAHGTDPLHIEVARLQATGQADSLAWLASLGRQQPSLGEVLTQAAHLDRFGLMPLAKQAMTQGDWTTDGIELGLKRQFWGANWTLDAGLWSGEHFPGSAATKAFAHLHLGAQWDGAWGNWAMDGFMAQLHPRSRASRIASINGAHTHAAPGCDANLNGVVCFDGQTRLSGLSAQWVAKSIPITVKAALLLRLDQGTLQSANGLGQYDARNQGQWFEAIWRMHPQWETALRAERVRAQHTIVGSGASLLATESGFGNYSPQQRTTAMLGYTVNPWVGIRLEAGREKTHTQSAYFVAARLVLNWSRSFILEKASVDR